MEAEVAPFADWLVWQALITPCLELHTAELELLDRDTWQVKLVVDIRLAAHSYHRLGAARQSGAWPLARD